ncbi:MAG: FAD-binding oxidoreductase [Cyanothece sp. SIO1E1]|nr:FAD-binding oxidoreductase [Cyanothece sp. SIO1E1]
MSKSYLGFKETDLESEYLAFYHEKMAEIHTSVEVSSKNPLAWGTLPDVDQMTLLEEAGDMAVETGFSVAEDGSIAVAVKTFVPNTSPQMWDWWFGWHGSENQRYKLWHPKAHISARWEDGRSDNCYIGRNSIIKEFIGENELDAAIQFKSPLEFGFSYDSVNQSQQSVYICAKLGHPKLPVDYGYLVHQVRLTSTGTEMRSRFWVGGKYVGARHDDFVNKAAVAVLKKFKSLPAGFGHDLLLHCAEEMSHLSTILPDLYQKYANDGKVAISGRTINRGDVNFEEAVMDTLFNKVPVSPRPTAIYEPRTIEDIINVVRYAKKVGRRISITSGGHSFSANFLREDYLLIDMKNFNQFSVNAEEKTAQAGPAVGGSTLMKALYKKNLFFPAGHCQGVCLGGYLLQGGYGWNGRKLGIACESVLGLDIITADGQLVYADAQTNTDLFWAARGAGAGFFGIVVKFYLRVYDLPKYRAVIVHNFAIKHLEAVYRWANEVGPEIPKAVEFQMLMSKNVLRLLGPGIEAIAPIFADTKEEFEEAKKFMKNSPIAHKAMIKTPAINPGIDLLYKTVMSHYPDDHCWGVDNMWTHASTSDLLPYIQEIAKTLPAPPSHFLWLNWHPGELAPNMAYSNEDNIYLSLYSCWKNPADTQVYGNWASDMMRKMQHLSTGIQLADEALHKRTATFMATENLDKVQTIRAARDPQGIFHEWHSKPTS